MHPVSSLSLTAMNTKYVENRSNPKLVGLLVALFQDDLATRYGGTSMLATGSWERFLMMLKYKL